MYQGDIDGDDSLGPWFRTALKAHAEVCAYLGRALTCLTLGFCFHLVEIILKALAFNYVPEYHSWVRVDLCGCLSAFLNWSLKESLTTAILTDTKGCAPSTAALCACPPFSHCYITSLCSPRVTLSFMGHGIRHCPCFQGWEQVAKARGRRQSPKTPTAVTAGGMEVVAVGVAYAAGLQCNILWATCSPWASSWKMLPYNMHDRAVVAIPVHKLCSIYCPWGCEGIFLSLTLLYSTCIEWHQSWFSSEISFCLQTSMYT